MNFAKIYSDISGRKELFDSRNPDIDKKESQLPESPEVQLHLQWLENPETVKMVKDLTLRVNRHIQIALDLSVAYHQHNNHQQIISNLIVAKTLLETIETYGSH